MTAFRITSWEAALEEFLLHKQAASSSAKTVRYYKVQLLGLSRWCDGNNIPLKDFVKRDLDRYLVQRKADGKSQLTLHHDAITAKVFFKWCAREKVLTRSPLAEYEVMNAPVPQKYMPKQDDVTRLLDAVRDYWNPDKNPAVKFNSVAKRSFHRQRNQALFVGLVDTSCRIGELLSMKVDDVDTTSLSVTIGKAKGKKPRTVPISDEWAEMLLDWLKTRERIMKLADEDEGYVFITEVGGRLDECRCAGTLKKFVVFAGLPTRITLHSLRRYSINKLSKVDVLAAQRIAGHKETKTTLLYTELDPEHLREAHAKAASVKGIVTNKRTEKKKRLV